MAWWGEEISLYGAARKRAGDRLAPESLKIKVGKTVHTKADESRETRNTERGESKLRRNGSLVRIWGGPWLSGPASAIRDNVGRLYPTDFPDQTFRSPSNQAASKCGGRSERQGVRMIPLPPGRSTQGACVGERSRGVRLVEFLQDQALPQAMPKGARWFKTPG